MKNTIEPATELIHRAACVDANALPKDYRTLDTSELPEGTVVNKPAWAFFKLDNPDMRVSNTGRSHTNEEPADIPRDDTGGGCV